MKLSRTTVAPLAVLAVGLALYAGWTLLDVGGEYDEMAEDAYLDADGNASIDVREEAEQRRERMAAVARGAARAMDGTMRPADPLLAENEVEPPNLDPAGPLTASDVEAGFDYAMRRVERIARTRRKLEQDEWTELYREANDAYAAYSMHLDATEPGDLAKLEDAHKRLKAGLKRVRVRGRKFQY